MHTGTLAPPDIWPINDFEAQLPHHFMQWVEGGSFTIGSNDDEALKNEKHLITITLPSFCMARFPVTQALYAFMMDGENPSEFKGENRPVEMVSWDEAKEFIKKLNEKTGRAQAIWRYSLPSEAQWEYAARGGEAGAKQNFRYAGSNKLKEVGWFDKNSHQETKSVGLKKPNILGLYDMTGNVEEWCEDDWHNSYENMPLKNGSAWIDAPERGSGRIYRGGSWDLDPQYCRVACRYDWIPVNSFVRLGFRLCLAPSLEGT